MICGVLIVLGDAEVTSGNSEVGVVIDFHDDGCGYAAFPCVVAEGFAERVAGHARTKPEGLGGGADDAVGLYTADCAAFAAFN